MAGHHQAVVIQVCVRSDVRQLGGELWFQRQHCTWAMATRGSLTIYRYDIDIDIDIDMDTDRDIDIDTEIDIDRNR